MSAINVALFERPGADFVLRRALELVSDRASARQALGKRSRFVVVFGWQNGAHGLYFDDLPAVFRYLAAFRAELGPDAPRFELSLAVSASTRDEIDTGSGYASNGVNLGSVSSLI